MVMAAGGWIPDRFRKARDKIPSGEWRKEPNLPFRFLTSGKERISKEKPRNNYILNNTRLFKKHRGCSAVA